MGPTTTLARQAVKLAGAAVDTVMPPRRGVSILLYHRVGARSPLEIDLPAALFRTQLEALRAGSRVSTLDQAVTQLVNPEPPEFDPVVVTFDDGTEDVVDVAVPILAELGVPALLYVATGFIDEGRQFPAGGRPASWAGLADALDSGILTVGSHTHSHRLLDRLPLADAVDELDRSVALLGERLGIRAEHFAYPKAMGASGPVAAAVAVRFKSAAVAGGGTNRYGATDVYRLARSPIQRSDGLRWFRRKAAGGLTLEGRLRGLASRSRYSGAVT